MGANFRVIVAAAAIMCFSASAMAESTFLLQLGSFTTEGEASGFWQRVSGEHGELLKDYRYQPMQVTVPPDDYTVHRVQVGPVPDQQTAQELCDALNAKQVSCYIVETAMFAPSPDAQPVAATAPEPSMAAMSEPAPEAASAETLPEPETVVPAASPALPQPVEIAAPAVPSPVPQAMLEPQFAARPELAMTAENAAPAASEPISLPWRDENAAAPQPGPAISLSATAEPTLQAPTNPALLPARSVTELNAATGRDAPPPTVAPGTMTAPAFAASSAPSSSEGNIVIAERAPRMLAVPSRPSLAPMPSLQTPPLAAPAPMVAMPEPMPLQGEVTVAEAIPVPLSEAPQPEYVATPSPTYRPRALGWGASPSQNFRQQALWAELDYFASERDAVNYWSRLRSRQPQVMQGMRMRITKPYFQQGAASRVSLRMGPFVSMMDVREVCDLSTSDGLRCGVVRDLGPSVAANQPRYRPFAAPANPYQQRADAMGRAMHWVVLGSFASQAEAQGNWQGLSMRHGDLLGRLQPNVERPAFSSAQQSIFRLRTGPFASQLSAQDLCNGLRMRGTGCVVVVAR